MTDAEGYRAAGYDRTQAWHHTEHTMAHSTYRVRINNTRLYLTIDDSGWRWVDGGEQCHDCGGDAFYLMRNSAGVPVMLRCTGCGSKFELKHVLRD